MTEDFATNLCLLISYSGTFLSLFRDQKRIILVEGY